MQTQPQLSFIIPIKDEEGSVKQLATEIIKVCRKIKKSYEIIFVDDGSTDQSGTVIKKLVSKHKGIKLIQLRGNFGKSIALSAGFSQAQGEIIFTMDGDLQDKPQEIPRFLEKLNQGYDLVSGWKKIRHDPLSKTLPSKIFNRAAARLTHVPIHDFNCGFKAYKRQVIGNLNLYGELYRFIPALAAQKRFLVGEIIVEHQARRFGKSKYGWTRMIRGFFDLLTIIFLTSYSSRPGHFFGTLGLLFFIPGFLIGLYIAYLRFTTGGIAYRYPLLFLGVLLMIVAIQFISTGLLAEMILNSREQENLQKIIRE
jgi:glycosyltransferase involved in cell wall biosynthesis